MLLFIVACTRKIALARDWIPSTTEPCRERHLNRAKGDTAESECTHGEKAEAMAGVLGKQRHRTVVFSS
jgi:hypothetical protein